MCDLRSSPEFTENALEEKVKNLEERCESMETKLQELYNNQIHPECVYNNLADLEDRSRRCNLRLERITEKKDETWERCEKKIQNIFKEKLGLENINTERAHRSKGKTSSNKAFVVQAKEGGT